jgi:hypothetical protein
VVKKQITRVYYAKYKQKTGPYPPLYPKIISTLPFQPENKRVLSSLAFTHWVNAQNWHVKI